MESVGIFLRVGSFPTRGRGNAKESKRVLGADLPIPDKKLDPNRGRALTCLCPLPNGMIALTQRI